MAWASDGRVKLLDQTKLPRETRFLEIDTVEDAVEAIQALRVRGAPLIGVAAAMSLAAAAARQVREGRLGATPGPVRDWLEQASTAIAGARPTAVNLHWAVERARSAADRALAALGPEGAGAIVARALQEEAQRIWDEDAAMCRAMGEAGAARIPEGSRVLTHCNTGMLATGGIGTAFATIRVAHEQGKDIEVLACEARPLRQGSRLTAWELARVGIPGVVIVDSAAASTMARGQVDLVVVGADRIAANGDVANKIGTYSLAVLAHAHGIPFYVVAPRSTIDMGVASGREIPIEQRAASEVETAPGIAVYNPAFDVTPARLVTAIITDVGVVEPPFAEQIAAIMAREPV